MFYRTRIDLAFTTKKSALKATESALAMLENAKIINPAQDNEERGFIQVEKCYHDLNPNQPCELIVRHEVQP